MIIGIYGCFIDFWRSWATKNKPNIMVNSFLFIVHSKDEERQFEKTKPISWLIVRSTWFIAKTKNGKLKKQTQFSGVAN